MVTIKFKMYEIMWGINDWINKTLESKVCIFDSNYSEVYISPKQTELYVKTKVGKSYRYKKVKYFFSTNHYNNDMHVTFEDHTTHDKSVEFDCELAIEQNYNKENK